MKICISQKNTWKISWIVINLALLLTTSCAVTPNSTTGTKAVVNTSQPNNQTTNEFAYSGTPDIQIESATPIPSPPPTTTLEASINEIKIYEFKIAYPKIIDEELKEIWLVENDETPRKIYSVQPQERMTSPYFAWSHDGKKLAFDLSVENDLKTVSVINIDNLEVKSIPVLAASTDAYINFYGWAYDDQWLALAILSSMHEKIKTVLVNVNTEETIVLADENDFLIWSPIENEEYLYRHWPDYPDLRNESMYLKNLYEDAPKMSFAGLEDYSIYFTSLAWSGNENVIIMTAFGKSNSCSDCLLLLNPQSGNVTELPFDEDYSLMPNAWSSNGEWVALWNCDIVLINMASNSFPKTRISEADFILSEIGWYKDTNDFLYEEGGKIFVINPKMPDERKEIFDLNPYETVDRYFPLNVWIPYSIKYEAIE
ncbi:MAG: hypothetical protein JXB38_03525 [Anaerolineales bacterium]|nr:hypothetical protein [Anaerolineales bacterium]